MIVLIKSHKQITLYHISEKIASVFFYKRLEISLKMLIFFEIKIKLFFSIDFLRDLWYSKLNACFYLMYKYANMQNKE